MILHGLILFPLVHKIHKQSCPPLRMQYQLLILKVYSCVLIFIQLGLLLAEPVLSLHHLRLWNGPTPWLWGLQPSKSILMLWWPRKTTTVSEPPSFNQGNKSVEWRAAIQDEFDALISNRTVSLVPKPPAAYVVGNKWWYRIKRSADGRVKRFKGSIGCKGFHTTVLYRFHWKF